MTYQTSSNGYVAYKVQSAKGSQESGASAEVLRITGGAGGQMTKEVTESAEVRRDGMSTRGRHGSQRTSGAHETEASLGNLSTIMQALMRGTYSNANAVVDDETAAMSSASISVASNVITASAGSWITAGFRVGQIVRESEGLNAADRNKNMWIVGLTAAAMTVLRVDGVALTNVTGPVANYTFTTTGRRLINPAAGAAVERYFTIEEHEVDIDGSEVFTDCKWTGMAFSMAPNGMFIANPSWMGTGQMDTFTGGAAPVFTSPTETSGEPMAAINAKILLGSTSIIDLTTFSLTIDTQPNVPNTIATYGPDVLLGNMRISMELGMLREDLADVSAFIAETQNSLNIIVQEPESAPADFVALHVPNFTFGSVGKSPFTNAGGARTQTISIPPALIGKDIRGGAYDPTMIAFQTSA